MTLGRRPGWGQTLDSGVTTVGGGQDRFPNTEALGEIRRMAIRNQIVCLCLFLCHFVILSRIIASEPNQPKVWIYTDMSDPTLPGNNHRGTINDPDDVSAMAGYLLMANRFETLGIVVTSTHRKEHATTPNQAAWANE